MNFKRKPKIPLNVDFTWASRVSILKKHKPVKG